MGTNEKGEAFDQTDQMMTTMTLIIMVMTVIIIVVQFYLLFDFSSLQVSTIVVLATKCG